MKKVLIYAFFVLMATSSLAQHYYKDLLVVEAANKKHSILRKNRVKSIKFLSFDADNNPIEGFSSDQQINKEFTEVITTTTTSLTGRSQNMSYFNSKDQLLKTVDSIEGSSNTNTYEYDGNGRITKTTSINSSTGGFLIKESHQWSYNSAGKPLSMLKIKNDKDSSFIEFVVDADGTVTEEKTKSKRNSLPTIFYYYESGNLTDIVRYNIVAKRLLPDYVFEYEDKDRLASMLVVPEEGGDYQKWYYSYDEDGLKILDACYSKTKQLIGRIEYHYEYYK